MTSKIKSLVPLFGMAVAAGILFAQPVKAQAPDVTFLRNGVTAALGTYTFSSSTNTNDSYVMNNGLVQFTWGRDDLGVNGWTGQTSITVQSVIKDGTELAHNLNGVAPRDPDRQHSFYIDNGGGAARLICSQIWVVQNTTDIAEIAIKDTSSSLRHEHHLFMRRGKSGVYGYNLLSTPSGASSNEIRMNPRWDRGLLDHAFNWERGPGMQGTYAYFFTQTTISDETWKCSGINRTYLDWPTNNSGNAEGGQAAGTVFSKYDWCCYHKENPMFGHFGHGFGAWFTQLGGITDTQASHRLRSGFISS